MEKLITFKIESDFALFKKPDINEVYLTYNLPPKPLLLGIFGAILGLKGLKHQYEKGEKYPEYYGKLKHWRTGIKPLGNFPFNKIINEYNSKNSYFGSAKYENITIQEQLLIRPKYQIFVLSDNEDSLFNKFVSLLNGNKVIFMPYMGKNEFVLKISDFEKIGNFEDIENFEKGKIDSIFLHKPINKEEKKESKEGLDSKEFYVEGEGLLDEKEGWGFEFYENFPIGFDKNMQYNLFKIKYTNKEVEKKELLFEEFSRILKIKDKIVYFF